MLILILIFVTIFFSHSLIRLCMLVVKARKREAMRAHLPEMVGSEGYAIPQEPIHVVLARDEEAAGVESEATKTGPPAYGAWRESVVCTRRFLMAFNVANCEPIESRPRPPLLDAQRACGSVCFY